MKPGNTRLLAALAGVLVSACDGSVVVERPGAATARLEPVASADAITTDARRAAPGAPDALPWPERVALEQALAAADARYAPRSSEAGFEIGVEGRARAILTSAGAEVSVTSAPSAPVVRNALRAIGRGASLAPPDAGL